MDLRRLGFWTFILAVIGLDLWWSGTPLTFEVSWIPLFVVNAVALGLVLWPLVRGRP